MITRRDLRAIPLASTLLITLAALALAGCAGDTTGATGASSGPAGTSPAGVTAQQLTAHEWQLNRTASTLSAQGTQAVTLLFAADGTFTGVGPCNSYGGSSTLVQATLTITGVRQTMRACAAAAAQAETEYLASLTGAHSVEAAGSDRLVLTSDRARLTYDAIDLTKTVTGDWPVVNIGSETALGTTLIGTHPVLSLHADRSLLLTTGCNDLTSSWSLDGDVISIPPARSTLKACSSPTGVMEQEAALGAALDAAHTVQATPEQLTLLSKTGKIVLVGTRGTGS